MALIACPECQSKVSSAATSCPQCGYPLSGASVQAGQVLGAVLGVLGLAFFMLGSGTWHIVVGGLLMVGGIIGTLTARSHHGSKEDPPAERP